MVATLRTAVIALCIGAMLGIAAGWVMRGDHLAAGQLQVAKQTIKATAQAQTAVDTLAETQANDNAAQAKTDRIIYKEVIKYVATTPAATRCNLPGPWRLHHDAAAIGTPADPARMAAGQADPIDDATALATVAENYQSARHYAKQVAGWNDWWGSVKHLCQGVEP